MFVLQRGPVGPRGPAGPPGAAGVPGVDGIDVSSVQSHKVQCSDVGQSCGSIHFWVNQLEFFYCFTQEGEKAAAV